MEDPVRRARSYRFDTFTLNVKTGELTKAGVRLPLREQPLQLLLLLLEQPGEMVTREALVNRLWPSGTFVDFERGLNKAINNLREVLGDSADEPRFIETLPRKGYRFIAPVTRDEETPEKNPPVQPKRRRWWIGLAATAACLAILVATNVGRIRDRLAARWRSAPQISALAVLPLENLSHDPEQEYFADGITDALITDLAKVTDVRITSRTSIMRYKGAKKTIKIYLKYDPGNAPVISSIERVSRPGCRVYVGQQDIPRVLGGLGINILTTARGVMTGRDAHKERVGGEILCRVW